jgi:hypothetical protein
MQNSDWSRDGVAWCNINEMTGSKILGSEVVN